MLKTNFLGLELKNPIIIAAGPWNRDGASLKASLAAGAGAVSSAAKAAEKLEKANAETKMVANIFFIL